MVGMIWCYELFQRTQNYTCLIILDCGKMLGKKSWRRRLIKPSFWPEQLAEERESLETMFGIAVSHDACQSLSILIR
jgi:hypothetical protein